MRMLHALGSEWTARAARSSSLVGRNRLKVVILTHRKSKVLLQTEQALSGKAPVSGDYGQQRRNHLDKATNAALSRRASDCLAREQRQALDLGGCELANIPSDAVSDDEQAQPLTCVRRVASGKEDVEPERNGRARTLVRERVKGRLAVILSVT